MVNIEEEMRKAVAIKDLTPMMSQFNLYVIVIAAKGNTYTTNDGKEVKGYKVGDKTGCVDISVWGEYCQLIEPGDILLMHNCYAKLYRNKLTVYRSKTGKITKLGEFTLLFNDQPDMSAYNEQWIKQQEEADKLKKGGSTGNKTHFKSIVSK